MLNDIYAESLGLREQDLSRLTWQSFKANRATTATADLDEPSLLLDGPAHPDARQRHWRDQLRQGSRTGSRATRARRPSRHTRIARWRPWPKSATTIRSALKASIVRDWFHQLHHGKISQRSDHGGLLERAEVVATERTMVSQKRSLGGQLDLLVKFGEDPPGWSTSRRKSPATAAVLRDRAGYAAQAGGYLWLMDEGDGAKDERPPYVEKCRTLIVTPKRSTGSPPWTQPTAPCSGKKPGAPIRPLPWSVDPRPSRTQDTPPDTNPTP